MLAHLSAEAGHRALATALGLRPLLDFGMRLGEGSAATLVVPLLHAAGLNASTGSAPLVAGGQAKPDSTRLEYRRLGKTGLKVTFPGFWLHDDR